MQGDLVIIKQIVQIVRAFSLSNQISLVVSQRCHSSQETIKHNLFPRT